MRWPPGQIWNCAHGSGGGRCGLADMFGNPRIKDGLSRCRNPSGNRGKLSHRGTGHRTKGRTTGRRKGYVPTDSPLLRGPSDVHFADGLQAQRLGHLAHHLLRAGPVTVPVVVDERLVLVVAVQPVSALVDYRDVPLRGEVGGQVLVVVAADLAAPERHVLVVVHGL